MGSIGPLCQYGTAIVSTSVPKRHVDEWTVPPSPSRVPAWMANAYNGGSASGPDKYQPTLSSVQDGFKEQGSETYVNSGATTLCGTWGVSLGKSANTNDGPHLGCPSDVSTQSQRRLETDVCVAVATIGTWSSRSHCWVASLYRCSVASLCLQGKQSSSQKKTRSSCVHHSSLVMPRRAW